MSNHVRLQFSGLKASNSVRFCVGFQTRDGAVRNERSLATLWLSYLKVIEVVCGLVYIPGIHAKVRLIV